MAVPGFKKEYLYNREGPRFNNWSKKFYRQLAAYVTKTGMEKRTTAVIASFVWEILWPK